MDSANPREKLTEPSVAAGEARMTPGRDPTPSAADLRRRRLLRGLASVPAVYTLGNGAHAAVLSSHQCVGMLDGEGEVVHETAGDPAEKGVLHVLNQTDSSGRMGICAGGFQRGVPSYQGIKLREKQSDDWQYFLFNYTPTDDSLEGTYYDQSGRKWEVKVTDDSKGYNFQSNELGVTISVSKSRLDNGRAAKAEKVDVLPAVYVNNQGAVAFYPDKTEGMVGISCSCWSSFAPGNGNPSSYEHLG